ncbi:MAG: hypothetical protein MK116_04250 [Phycisphaerales bacterium]|nr:hypothetical protein [Phycisphaerales bacterium]
MSASGKPLRILIVEDAFLIGMDLKMSLEQMGYEVLGPAPSSARAMSLLQREVCHGAILDVSLGRETSESVADFLVDKNVPFFFLTGYNNANLVDESLQEKPLYHKPMNRESLAEAVQSHIVGGQAA